MNGMNKVFLRSRVENWLVGIYCRLSKDDDLQGESASIGNQRELLTGYCKAQGWTIARVYQDDGYTGLNMERPGLQQMLTDVESGKINLVITKDLSRLGRNYLQTGNLIEDFFPRHRVRYIAFNDNIDTESDGNDIAPFKNILNEMYSKDISKKIHSSYLVAARKGSYTGVVPPFGYLKDPEQKGHLIIDEETAPIIREIFQMAAAGRGPNYIRRALEEKKIPSPVWWNRERGWRNSQLTRWEKQDPENGKYVWDFSNISDMLKNPVYIGSMASQKRNYRFKIGNISDKKPDEWVVVENCHEPIVSRDTFELVQRKLKSRQRKRDNGECSLFAGLIKCGDCGKALTHRTSLAGKEPIPVYCCKTYNAYGKNHCTQHRITEKKLEDVVLEAIRESAKAASISPSEIEQKLQQAAKRRQLDAQEKLTAAIADAEAKMKLLTDMIGRLYEDRMFGRISEENFAMMMAKTQQEQQEQRQQLDELHNQQIALTEPPANDKWRELIRPYTDMETLDVETLNRLVNKIVVFESIDSEHVRHLRVEIHFNFQPVPDEVAFTPKEQRPYLHPEHGGKYVEQASYV